MFKEAASWGPWGAGSTRAMIVVFGFEMMDWACRGPMRPPPRMAILSFGEEDMVLAVTLEDGSFRLCQFFG